MAAMRFVLVFGIGIEGKEDTTENQHFMAGIDLLVIVPLAKMVDHTF